MPLPSSLTSIEANALLEEIGLRKTTVEANPPSLVYPADDTSAGQVSSAPPPVDDPRIKPTAKNPYPYCLSGCGEKNKPGSKFKPGHDARVKGILNRVKVGKQESKRLSNELLEAARGDPKFAVADYTAAEILDLARWAAKQPQQDRRQPSAADEGSAVFEAATPGANVIVIQEGWDIPTGDLVRNLERNGIDPASLADAYEKLYRSG